MTRARSAPPLLPGQPAADGEPAFFEPWQAEAFAITIALFEDGHFTWEEWSQALGREIAAAGGGAATDQRGCGEAEAVNAYFSHWLGALEKMAQGKKIVTEGGLMTRREAWRAAYLATPHGQPVRLANADT